MNDGGIILFIVWMREHYYASVDNNNDDDNDNGNEIDNENNNDNDNVWWINYGRLIMINSNNNHNDI